MKGLESDLGGVHVVVNEGVNDGGQLGRDDEVAGGLKVGNDLAECVADLGREIYKMK